jgi:hypothetical protein
MGTERTVSPSADRRDSVVAKLRIVAGRQIEQDLFDLIDFVHLEGFYLPEALRDRTAGVVRRIEDVVEPALCFGIALVLAELKRDRERDVVEYLPVVGGVATRRREIEILGGKLTNDAYRMSL